MPFLMAMARGKFQFTNRGAQRAEAMLNAREATALLDRWLPRAPEPTKEPEPTTAAGSCFRRVVALLEGRK